MRSLLTLWLFLFSPFMNAAPASAEDAAFDVAILHGRVIDPETGVDTVRNVGVRGDKIAEVTEEAISGKRVIDAQGLVVAPGFIDLHAHGQTVPAGRVQAHDGVTTALELESGEYPISSFYEAAAEEGRPIHYGASVGWSRARIAEFVKRNRLHTMMGLGRIRTIRNGAIRPPAAIKHPGSWLEFIPKTATFSPGPFYIRTSAGFKYVIVAGTPLVWDGELDTTVLPGRPIRRATTR